MFLRFCRQLSTSLQLRSAHSATTRKTLVDLANIYKSNKPISVMTCYDSLTAKMVSKAGIDIALVGDSLAMTSLGYEDTNEISLQEFIYHAKAVSRGNQLSFIVADLPFGSFESSLEKATESAIQLVKQGRVQALKVEGGNEETLPIIRKLVSIGIPVMGHVGLTPQKHNTLGGFKLQGNTIDSAVKVYQECLNVQKAGAFAVVLECIPNKLSEYITESLSIPTIGIGAGPNCSGQVLVIADMLGMSDPETSHTPKFVKKYDNFFEKAVSALGQYQKDLEEKKFPVESEHGYKIKKDVLEEFRSVAKTMN